MVAAVELFGRMRCCGSQEQVQRDLVSHQRPIVHLNQARIFTKTECISGITPVFHTALI